MTNAVAAPAEEGGNAKEIAADLLHRLRTGQTSGMAESLAAYDLTHGITGPLRGDLLATTGPLTVGAISALSLTPAKMPVLHTDQFTTYKSDPFKAGQIGGNHYEKMAIQPFQYSMANGLDPMQHTIIKYVTRFREKNGIEDLKKARHVIDLLIAHETKGKA